MRDVLERRRHVTSSSAGIGRLPALLILAASILLAGPAAGAQSSQPPTVGEGRAATCTVRETSRAPLTVDGSREMYIEATAVLPSRGEILLAGSPNYLYAPGRPDDARDFTQDSVFGAILDGSGRARLVPAPIDPTRITDVRGIAREEGGWALAFAELKHPWRPPTPDTVVRYWYGVFDGRSWVRLEPLPLPPDGEIVTAGASALLVRGDTTFLAVRVIPGGATAGLAMYQRRQGSWSVTMLWPGNAAYATLAYADSLGLLLGVVRPDRTRTYDINSFYLHTGPGWSNARKLLPGSPEPVYEPTIASSPYGPVLTWVVARRSGRHVRAMVGTLAPEARVLTIDSATNRVLYLPGLRQSPLWLSEHVSGNVPSELRFVGLSADQDVVVLGGIPTPYTGLFGAAVTGPEDLLISGPLLRRDSPNPSLVSLLIRARVECDTRAP